MCAKKEKQLGLDINPSAITIGIGEAAENVDDDAGLVNTASLFALEELSDKEIMLSIPNATLHLLKQDGDTKTLASPQIRVINNEKATIHIGERIPLRTNRRVDTNGDITYDYQYQDIGVKLDATPTININDEISLNINLDIEAFPQQFFKVGCKDPRVQLGTLESTPQKKSAAAPEYGAEGPEG